MIHIRPMEFADIDQLLVIENASFGTPWPRSAFEEELTTNMLAVYFSAVEAAAQGERVIGYCGLWHIVDEGHITNVAVHPDYRRRGVGRMMMTQLVNWALAHEVKALTLEVRPSNIPAQTLYRDFGFSYAGTRKAYYSDNGEDAWILWKSMEESGEG